MPGRWHAWPKSADCWSPAMPATGIPPGRPSHDVCASEPLLVPVERMDVEEQRARRIACIGHVHGPARELPCEPRIHRPERELPRFGALARPGNVVEQPCELR